MKTVYNSTEEAINALKASLPESQLAVIDEQLRCSYNPALNRTLDNDLGFPNGVSLDPIHHFKELATNWHPHFATKESFLKLAKEKELKGIVWLLLHQYFYFYSNLLYVEFNTLLGLWDTSYIPRFSGVFLQALLAIQEKIVIERFLEKYPKPPSAEAKNLSSLLKDRWIRSGGKVDLETFKKDQNNTSCVKSIEDFFHLLINAPWIIQAFIEADTKKFAQIIYPAMDHFLEIFHCNYMNFLNLPQEFSRELTQLELQQGIVTPRHFAFLKHGLRIKYSKKISEQLDNEPLSSPFFFPDVFQNPWLPYIHELIKHARKIVANPPSDQDVLLDNAKKILELTAEYKSEPCKDEKSDDLVQISAHVLSKRVQEYSVFQNVKVLKKAMDENSFDRVDEIIKFDSGMSLDMALRQASTVPMLNHMIALNADINAADEQGVTPLLSALLSGRLTVARYLYEILHAKIIQYGNVIDFVYQENFIRLEIRDSQGSVLSTPLHVYGPVRSRIYDYLNRIIDETNCLVEIKGIDSPAECEAEANKNLINIKSMSFTQVISTKDRRYQINQENPFPYREMSFIAEECYYKDMEKIVVPFLFQMILSVDYEINCSKDTYLRAIETLLLRELYIDSDIKLHKNVNGLWYLIIETHTEPKSDPALNSFISTLIEFIAKHEQDICEILNDLIRTPGGNIQSRKSCFSLEQVELFGLPAFPKDEKFSENEPSSGALIILGKIVSWFGYTVKDDDITECSVSSVKQYACNILLKINEEILLFASNGSFDTSAKAQDQAAYNALLYLSQQVGFAQVCLENCLLKVPPDNIDRPTSKILELIDCSREEVDRTIIAIFQSHIKEDKTLLYKCRLTLKDVEIAMGNGNTKEMSRNEAMRQALRKLGEFYRNITIEQMKKLNNNFGKGILAHILKQSASALPIHSLPKNYFSVCFSQAMADLKFKEQGGTWQGSINDFPSIIVSNTKKKNIIKNRNFDEKFIVATEWINEIELRFKGNDKILDRKTAISFIKENLWQLLSQSQLMPKKSLPSAMQEEKRSDDLVRAPLSLEQKVKEIQTCIAQLRIWENEIAAATKVLPDSSEALHVGMVKLEGYCDRIEKKLKKFDELPKYEQNQIYTDVKKTYEWVLRHPALKGDIEKLHKIERSKENQNSKKIITETKEGNEAKGDSHKAQYNNLNPSAIVQPTANSRKKKKKSKAKQKAKRKDEEEEALLPSERELRKQFLEYDPAAAQPGNEDLHNNFFKPRSLLRKDPKGMENQQPGMDEKEEEAESVKLQSDLSNKSGRGGNAFKLFQSPVPLSKQGEQASADSDDEVDIEGQQRSELDEIDFNATIL